MGTIILINLPSATVRTPEEHCGLAYLHAFLKTNGISAVILDSYALHLSFEETLSRIRRWIAAQNPGSEIFVGISPFVTSHDNFVRLGETLYAEYPKIKIIAGGHYASLNKEYMLSSFVWLNGIIVGEGEKTLLQVVNGDQAAEGFYSRYTKNDFKPRPRIMDLDELPRQTRYLTPKQLQGQPFALSTSRGCYGNCKFCSISSFYHCNTPEIKQTFRSAESVYDEIMYLHEKYGVVNFKIIDDNFFRNKDNLFLRKLSDKLCHENFSFRLSSRPDDITEENAVLLFRMGVKIIALGVESANNNLLKWIRKGTTVQNSLNAIDILAAHKIDCLANFIMFLPVMSIDELLQNYALVKKLSGKAVFHRIDSHLWLRATDPIVQDLISEGLSDGEGFPYIQYHYRHKKVEEIYTKFSGYCRKNMKEYYLHVDKLMAHGTADYEEDLMFYRKIIQKDLSVLNHLIAEA